MAAYRPTDALRILMQFMRVQESGNPYAFRFEPQDYILPTAGGESPSARFDWTEEVLSDLQAVRLPGRDPALVQRVGERLRSFVKDVGWAQHELHIAEARAERRPIFLTIRSSAAELYALPWELLTLSSGEFIGDLEGFLIRFEWPEMLSAKEQSTPHPEGGRILVAWSAAAGAVPAADHIQAIAAACQEASYPFDVTTDILAHASLEQLIKTLAEAQEAPQPIAVLHLLCHGAAVGSTFGLVLDGASGAVVVDATELRRLAPFATQVRLVVLSACDSGNLGGFGNQLTSVAQELHRCGFSAVIASRFPLSVAGSVTLTQTLYRELLIRPASLETAFLAARRDLSGSESSIAREYRSLDWASVQLYACHDNGDDTRPLVFRPYRGLLAFQPEHRRFFFGRDSEVMEILKLLKALIEQKRERFLVIAGGSGAGKSSIVLAGVVPSLLQEDPQLAVLRMRLGSDLEKSISDALGQRPVDAPALLLVDQCEQIFTQTKEPAARTAFMRRLWSLAAAPAPDIRVIILLRINFISRCSEILLNDAGLRLDHVAYNNQHRVFIAQLQPESLRAAIIEPARKVGLELQAGLPERIIQEAGSEPGALPLLSDALDVLWQQRDGRKLTQAVYNELGGVSGALRRRAEVFMERLSREDLAIARHILLSLVAVADDPALDTRRSVALSDLRDSITPDESASFERLLHDLVEARLLVRDDHEQTPIVEFAHEALVRQWPQLRTWLDENRAAILSQRRIARDASEWERQGRDASLLYRGVLLAQAMIWRKSWAFWVSHRLERFLHESEALQAKEEAGEAARREQDRKYTQTLRWRNRLAATLTPLLLLIATVSTVRACQVSDAAKRQAPVPTYSKRIVAASLSPDGKRMVAVASDGTLLSWQDADPSAGALFTGLKPLEHKVVQAAWFNAAGTRMVTMSGDATLWLWEIKDGPEDAVLLTEISLDGNKDPIRIVH